MLHYRPCSVVARCGLGAATAARSWSWVERIFWTSCRLPTFSMAYVQRVMLCELCMDCVLVFGDTQFSRCLGVRFMDASLQLSRGTSVSHSLCFYSFLSFLHQMLHSVRDGCGRWQGAGSEEASLGVEWVRSCRSTASRAGFGQLSSRDGTYLRNTNNQNTRLFWEDIYWAH